MNAGKLPIRFDSEDIPYNIHSLQNGEKVKIFMKDEEVIKSLSDDFDMNPKIISKVFCVLNKMNAKRNFLSHHIDWQC